MEYQSSRSTRGGRPAETEQVPAGSGRTSKPRGAAGREGGAAVVMHIKTQNWSRVPGAGLKEVTSAGHALGSEATQPGDPEPEPLPMPDEFSTRAHPGPCG